MTDASIVSIAFIELIFELDAVDPELDITILKVPSLAFTIA